MPEEEALTLVAEDPEGKGEGRGGVRRRGGERRG